MRFYESPVFIEVMAFSVFLQRIGTGFVYLPSPEGRPLAAVGQPWELALAEKLEDRFAEIRRLARSVSRVRMAFRQHAKLERLLAEQGDEETA